MSYIKEFDEYINKISKDESQTGGINFILIYINDKGCINFNVATKLIYLVSNFFDYDFNQNTTPREILLTELKSVNSKVGAIYEKKADKFQLLVISN